MSYSTFKKSAQSMKRYAKKMHPDFYKKLKPKKDKVSKTRRVPKWQKA